MCAYLADCWARGKETQTTTKVSFRLSHYSTPFYLLGILIRLPLKCVSLLGCQRLLGMMASVAIALPLGMLRMRPFQMWYLSLRLNAVTDRHRRVVVSSRCRKALENPLVSRRVGHYGHSVASRSGDHRRLHHGVGGSL